MKSLASKGLVMQSREDITSHETIDWKLCMSYTNRSRFFCEKTIS